MLIGDASALSPEIRKALIIADLERGLPYKEICDRHGVNKQAVSKIAVRAGLKRGTKQRLLTDEQETEIASRYVAGEKTVDLGAAFHVSPSLIWEALRRTGTVARSSGRVMQPLRHDAFDALTPDAAYWLGFIFTDGTVGESRTPKAQPEIAVVLQKRDREHLVKLRDFLGSEHAITPITPAAVKINPGMGTGAWRYSFRSRQIAGRILSLGRYGPAVDPELAASRDFWRGVIDGDGSIGISVGIPWCSVVGSRWLLQAFVDFLGPVSSRRPLHVRPARTIFTVSTTYKTAEKVVDRLYSDAGTVLDRKAVRAAEILSMHDKPMVA